MSQEGGASRSNTVSAHPTFYGAVIPRWLLMPYEPRGWSFKVKHGFSTSVTTFYGAVIPRWLLMPYEPRGRSFEVKHGSSTSVKDESTDFDEAG
ncbi:hypothetical protein J6590_016264 [Homalodisca vitripennis]|nr:hypothetical protein J6590_016264 [Homalodisca vitripennis]